MGTLVHLGAIGFTLVHLGSLGFTWVYLGLLRCTYKALKTKTKQMLAFLVWSYCKVLFIATFRNKINLKKFCQAFVTFCFIYIYIFGGSLQLIVDVFR